MKIIPQQPKTYFIQVNMTFGVVSISEKNKIHLLLVFISADKVDGSCFQYIYSNLL